MNRREPFKVEKTDIEDLQERWERLARSYSSDRTLIIELFNQLKALYSSRGRFYHNLSHLRSLLDLCDSFRERIQDYDAVCFAIWFHDAVYRTRRTDNEEKSADLAERSLNRLDVPTGTREFVRMMIMATKDHRLDIDHEDLKMFLDFDLSILGSETEVYQCYAKAIRSEYRWVPAPLYRQGRRKVLESFIKKDSIYFTEDLAQKYEERARRNIEHELEFY